MEAAVTTVYGQRENLWRKKYACLIADGDNSVYKHILDHRPYLTPTVEEVKRKTHLVRNYCRKFREIATTGTTYVDLLWNRQYIIQKRNKICVAIFRIWAAVVKVLTTDLLNHLIHIYRPDINYFYKESKSNKENIVPFLQECGLYSKILIAVRYSADNAKRLIEDVTRNVATPSWVSL